MNPITKIFFALTLLISFNGSAQFEGLRNFYTDSLLKKKIVENGVSSVTEVITSRSSTNVNDRYTFDRKGNITETCRTSGKKHYKVRMEYNNKNQLIKTINYSNDDTTMISHWVDYFYDDKDRLIKKQNGFSRNGEQIISVASEKNYAQRSGRERAEEKEYYGAKFIKTIISYDSISGIYSFEIKYEYKPGDEDAKGRKKGKKILIRKYSKDNTDFEDEIKYTVYGRLETASEVKSRYIVRDSAGREIEKGEINYDNAYMAFMQRHPEDFNPHVYSRLFLKELFEGKVKGDKEIKYSWFYDSKGLLVEKQHLRNKHFFKYNEKGQVIQQIKEGYGGMTEDFSYNNKGLISEIITYPKKNNTEEKYLHQYVYTYY